MSTVIVSNPGRVWSYVSQKSPVPISAGMQGLGVERDGNLIAGVLYEGYTGHNIWMHVAADPGKFWLNKKFLRSCFLYPFVQLGCQRVSGWVESSNQGARKLDEHLGFKQEAVLHGAARDGGDVLVYVMWRDECRFIRD